MSGWHEDKENKPELGGDDLPVLAPGYWVCVALRSGHLPPVGVLQAIDAYGIRLTHIDWLVGMASGWDVFIPWSEILHMDIATPRHSLHEFGNHGINFQERYRWGEPRTAYKDEKEA